LSGKVDLSEFVSGFVAEAHEHLRSIHTNLLAVDAALGRGEASPRAVRDLFRALHTLKGLAGMIAVEPIVDLAHAMESVLRIGERAGGRLPADAFAPLLEATKAIEQRVRALAEGKPVASAPRRIVDALGRLEQDRPKPTAAHGVVELDPTIDAKLDASDRALLAGAIAQGQSAYQLGFSPSPERASAGVNITSVRERLALLGEIIKVVPTSLPRTAERAGGLRFVLLLVSGAPPEALREAAGVEEGDLASLTMSAAPAPEPESEPDSTPSPAEEDDGRVLGTQSGVVRVEVRKLDAAMEGLAELLVTRRRLVLAVDALAAAGADTRELRNVVHETTRQLRDMRRAVVALRMVSVAELCDPLPLLVRGLTGTTGRRVQLDLELGRIEVDKAVGERIWPLLVHLVRNAVDHGIEPPEARAARGKPEVARLSIRAIQRSNALVEIVVEDDGGGVDAVEAARRAGVTTPSDDSGLLALLARPGLSTRAVAGATSGRGMGLDIVRKTVAELGGEIVLSTARGVGTSFTLRVPVTIAIVDALAFEAAAQPFLVAVSSVEALADVDPRFVIEGPSPERSRSNAPAAMMRHGDAVVPLFDLAEILGVATGLAVAPMTLPRKAVLVRRARGLVGFRVDRMLGHHEVVVRPLIDPLVKTGGVTGTTDLGDGKPTLILDLGALADERTSQVGPGRAA
jgi:two-component system chemotaxis sensor kinase CheA